MTDGYDYSRLANSERLAVELMIRVTALENILIYKQLVTEEELKDQFTLLANKIMNIMNSNQIETNDHSKILENSNKEAEFNNLLKQLNINSFKISKGN